jgi:heme-degrading monooxygenase HmoA
MFATVILFSMPADTDWDALAKIAQERAESYYRNVPGLLSKSFLINRETGLYGGVYAWESEEAYEAFRASEAFRTALEKFGTPEIRAFDVPAYVEAGVVTLAE